MSNLNSRFKKIIKDDRILLKGTKFLVAVSGGLDSMCLLSLIGKLDLNSKDVFVVYVNHGQRIEAVNEQHAVSKYVRRFNYNFITETLDLEKRVNASETFLRNKRYQVIREIALKYDIDIVLTAHHLNDLGETFLMQTIRSGSAAGVTGIARLSERENITYYRPLLSISKKDLLAYAIDNEVIFFEDETNFSDETIRNRIRHHVFNDQFLSYQEYKHFLNFFKSFNELKTDAYRYYDKLIETNKIEINNSNEVIRLKFFSEMKYISLSNFLSHLIVKSGFQQISDNFINESVILIENQKKPQGSININNSYILFKDYQFFGIKSAILEKRKVAPTFRYNQWYQFKNEEVGVFFLDNAFGQDFKKKFFISLSRDSPPLKWRYRQTGDYVLTNGKIKKKLRRFFIDNKVSQIKRDHLLVLASGSNILYLEDFGYSGLFNTDKTDKITSVVLLR
ncbi:tRNA lysidine(34) synthetase TilS [Xylocopilactobacillus apis]|uniref:tRNA(Ile)-lysidine synthase n=1 Tax=Xylocopilactobacillus apis TaxID=2932183 RepID=A0AAU9D190_9LACO|nr:tRNA lysidine(34) synthetase TilS [Xylocopilactobacillus apis]BDR56246.1 tRNA(Ile)-lysidine synthase [Xylocopilactobacillus apis]